MNLTFEQLVEAVIAVGRGVSAANWEGVSVRPWWELSESEQRAILNAERDKHWKEIQQLPPESNAASLNEEFLARFDLESVRLEESQIHEYRRHLQTLKATTKSIASGLRQMLNERLAHVDYWSATQRLAVDRRLAAAGLPRLDVLCLALRKELGRILKRGRIKGEEEYYLVQEILSDADFPMEEGVKRNLEKMSLAFRPTSGSASHE